MIQHLETIQPQFRAHLVGVELQNFATNLQPLLVHPLISMCTIYWLSLFFHDPNWFLTNYNPAVFDILLDLVCEISSLHSSHHMPCLELLSVSFELETELDALDALEVRKRILDITIYLMECGCVLSVLDKVVRWTQGVVDIALIRYFTTKVLEMVGTPYSADFVSLMLNILNLICAAAPLQPEYKAVLIPFLVECQKVCLEDLEKVEAEDTRKNLTKVFTSCRD